mgnify:CR=1 FL=1
MYEDVVAIDTDVLVIHHIYTHDSRYEINEKFLRRVRENYKVGLTIHNLLELYGIAAMAWGRDKATTLYNNYLRTKNVVILHPEYPPNWTSYIDRIVEYIAKGMHYGDALIAWVIDETTPAFFITWNVRHFKGKIRVEVLTPEEFISTIKE